MVFSFTENYSYRINAFCQKKILCVVIVLTAGANCYATIWPKHKETREATLLGDNTVIFVMFDHNSEIVKLVIMLFTKKTTVLQGVLHHSPSSLRAQRSAIIPFVGCEAISYKLGLETTKNYQKFNWNKWVSNILRIYYILYVPVTYIILHTCNNSLKAAWATVL